MGVRVRVVVMCWCADGGAHGATRVVNEKKSEESIAYTFWPFGELFVALGRATNTNCARGLFGLGLRNQKRQRRQRKRRRQNRRERFEKTKPPVDCAAPSTPAGWWR